MDVHKNYFYNTTVVTILILMGNYVLFTFAKSIIRYPKLLTFIGQNTIIFYVFHYDTLMPLSLMADKLGINIDNWVGVLAKMAWSVTICVIISCITNRWAPELVGKRRSKCAM